MQMSTMACQAEVERHWWSDDEAEMGQFNLSLESSDAETDAELVKAANEMEESVRFVSTTESFFEDAGATVGFGDSGTACDSEYQCGPERSRVAGEASSFQTRRFPQLNQGELEELEASASSRDTKKQTKWGVQLFRQWLLENGKESAFENIPESSLVDSLRGFYASVRNKDGKLYSKSTYVGIRASINRHLSGAPHYRAVSIVNGDAFHQANTMFNAMLKRLKREGLDTTKHHDPISQSDFEKLQTSEVFRTDNPTGLQRKVWFDITLSFARRGRENLRELKADAFVFKVDESGKSYVEMRYNEATKNHQGDNLKDVDFEKKPRMYAIDNSPRCPVNSLTKYLSKRNPANDIFFQQARIHLIPDEQDVWYTSRPVGEKTLHNLMKTLSIEAGLSQVYTNHCVKATTITRLAHTGVEAREIMRISGHRSEQGIRSYNSDSSEEQKRMYSAILHGQENTCRPVQIPLQSAIPHTVVSRQPLAAVTPESLPTCVTNFMNTCTSINNSVQPTVFSKQFEVHNSTINVFNYH